MAQTIDLMGASYPDVPSVVLPKHGGGTASFTDVTDTTAEAADVASGKWFYTASGVKTAGTSSGGGNATWFGGIEAEFLHETRWSKKLSEASNWSSLTPSTTAQNLTWTTTYTSDAAANAVIDYYGKGYHSVTETLDFGTYNYIWYEDAYVTYAYTSAEASLGKVHTIADGLEVFYHYGARPRIASGSIVRPSPTTYGSYGGVASSAATILYRTAAGTLQIANNSSYGVSIASVAPAMDSTSKVKPNYFIIKTPTFGIRAHNTYMPVATFSSLVAASTMLNFRVRIYRVPFEYGLYTNLNDRVLDMLQGNAFPPDTLT